MPAEIGCVQLRGKCDAFLVASAFHSLRISRLGVEIDQTGTDKPLSLKDRLDRGQQFTRRIRLHDVSTCTRAQGFFCDVRRAVLTEEENFRIRRNLPDATSRLNSIQGGQTDVRQN